MQDSPAPRKRVFGPRPCDDCGTAFTPTSGRQKRCRSCQHEHELELKREDEARRRAAAKTPPNCVDCGAELPYIPSRGRRSPRCDTCRPIHKKAQDREHSRKWSENPGRKEYDAEWRRNNPERVRRTQQKYRDANPESGRKYLLSHLYGLTIEQFDALLAAQGGVCALCGNPPKPEGAKTTRVLHVDHDHATGRVRMLLCHSCNQALGLFRDDPVLMRAAADYVEVHVALHAQAASEEAGLLF